MPFFGVRAYGVHLNGYRFVDGRLHLWIGRRAPDKRVAPDKLDNIVAGGIGNGHSVVATLFKEAEEEGGVPASLVARARPAGAVSYLMRTDIGIRDDVLFVYDLELPADFTPKNSDGEIVRFRVDAGRGRSSSGCARPMTSSSTSISSFWILRCATG